MSPDTRNTIVVLLLIVSMSAGAALLLWLETPTRRWSPATLLMAERGQPVKDVLIELAGPDEAFEAAEYDCVIFPDGWCEWQPRGAHIRLLLVTPAPEPLDDAVARALLAALGSMHQLRGLDLARVRLHPDSDAGLDPRLPTREHDMGALLARKAIIQ